MIAHLLKQVADDKNFMIRRQRKNTVVFQEHGTIFGDFAGKAVVCFKIAVIRHLFSILFNDAKDIGDAPVQVLHGKRTVFYAIQYPSATDICIPWHFEIKPRLQ